MPVEQTDQIDYIGIENSTGNVVLTISDGLDWADSPAHLAKLQEKLNCYLRFYESGEIFESYPAAKGRSVAIQVVTKHDLSAEAITFMEKAKETIEGAGIISLKWKRAAKG
jgi:hypothetical protein